MALLASLIIWPELFIVHLQWSCRGGLCVMSPVLISRHDVSLTIRQDKEELHGRWPVHNHNHQGGKVTTTTKVNDQYLIQPFLDVVAWQYFLCLWVSAPFSASPPPPTSCQVPTLPMIWCVAMMMMPPEPLTCGDAPPPAPENGLMSWDESAPVGVSTTVCRKYCDTEHILG